MNPLAWLAPLHTIHQQDWIAAGVAGGLVLLSLAGGVLTCRRFGNAAQLAWRQRLGTHGKGVGGRLSLIIRHGVAAVLLAVALLGYEWPLLAAAPLGFALGAATALLAIELLRGVGLPRFIAYLIGLILFVALFSHAVGGLAPITDTLDAIGFTIGKRHFSLLSFVVMLVLVVAIFTITRLATRAVGHAIARSKGLDATQKLLGSKIASIVIIAIGFFFGIDLLDIDLTAFAVFSGALGLAVGFGLQKTVGNLIAGIILLMDRSIKPGDVIVVGEAVGEVNKIGVRAVSIVTRDGKEHLIPNENLMTQEVENWSYSDRNVRVRIPVPVAYSCDLKLAQQLMLRAATESPRVLKSPKPNVRLNAFGENGAEHEVLAWISDPESGVGAVRSDVLNRLWDLFKEHGIRVPYPHRDVHIRRD